MFEVYAQDYRITIQEIPLGNQGEDMARCLVIDITDAVNEFGSGGTVSVRNKRNGDELPYFCTNVSTVTGADAEGNVHTYIKWTLTDVDTAAAGSGFVQADYIISGTTVKTWVYKYFILPSLGITGDVPDPYEDILEEIEAQVSAVQTAAASAAASAAQASAEATRIISTTQEVVEDWLSDHIVTGYTVDDTLTISGAAADSATVGTQLRAAFVTEETSGSIASFTDGADGVPLKDLVVNIQPKQAGSGDPSPTNVRAISGYTSANITRCGKNLIDHVAINGTYSGITYTTNADGTITVSGTSTAPRYNILKQEMILPPGTYVGFSGMNEFEVYAYNIDTGSRYPAVSPFTLTDYTRVRIYLTVYANQTVNGTIYPMIRPVVFDNTYEPYNGNTYNISFGSAGTVYGGTLDVTTGMLTVTYGVLNVTSALYSGASGSASYWCQVLASGAKKIPNSTIGNTKASYLPTTSQTTMINTEVNAIATNNNGAVTFKIVGMTSKADYDTYLAAHPLTIVYELQNPISVQLTATEVRTLLGNNNIFADTGSVASCEYRADTKLYIEHLTTPDGDMIADANITSGSYFMVNNNLYLATANIANGGAITPGTNCTATNLAAALNAINS